MELVYDIYFVRTKQVKTCFENDGSDIIMKIMLTQLSMGKRFWLIHAQ